MLLLASGLLLLASSCASVNLDLVDMEPSVCMNDPRQVSLIVVKHFKRSVKAHFGLFGLATWSEPDIRKVLREEMERHEGNGVANLTVSAHYGFFDTIFGLPLSPLWFPRTYVLEGDVVMIKKPAPEVLPKLRFE